MAGRITRFMSISVPPAHRQVSSLVAFGILRSLVHCSYVHPHFTVTDLAVYIRESYCTADGCLVLAGCDSTAGRSDSLRCRFDVGG